MNHKTRSSIYLGNTSPSANIRTVDVTKLSSKDYRSFGNLNFDDFYLFLLRKIAFLFHNAVQPSRLTAQNTQQIQEFRVSNP